ncbi:hypothetical protein OPIT5_16755 [Opitutaceae bacterium TAV5]|nr:hypothetical protein OPIT5_16755 [Opitutaceae bacterium TAV5]
MKSTPEQTAKRRELKALTEELAELLHKQSPDVPEHAIAHRANEPVKEGEISYDDYFTLVHDVRSIPAKQTGGKVILRFRRRRWKAKRIRGDQLWQIWEPGYAATKPEAVEELLPVLRELVTKARRSKP